MFWEDPVMQVTEAQAKGDQVIIVADVNEDVKGTITKKHIRKMGKPLCNYIRPDHHLDTSKAKNQLMESLYHPHYLKEQKWGL